MSEKPSAADLRKLLALYKAGSPGEWRIDRGLMAKSIWITTSLREMNIGDRGRDGPICNVSTEKIFSRPTRHGSHKHEIETRPLKNAEDDARLICAAVNALPCLIAALLGAGQVDETAWLIEFAADKYGPTRYLSIGEPPVISASDATRFARKEDAERYMLAHEVRGGKATEHAWTGILPSELLPSPDNQPSEVGR